VILVPRLFSFPFSREKKTLVGAGHVALFNAACCSHYAKQPIPQARAFFVFVSDGSKVNLGSTTIAFTKSIAGFLEDGLRVNTPEVRKLLQYDLC
jgi:hypothetical protein